MTSGVEFANKGTRARSKCVSEGFFRPHADVLHVSSSKKVRTFARIPDRTPIIIGGLVSKKVEKRQGKLLGLSDIPVLGKLFTSKDDEIQKREVIIVLTPYILAEDSTGVAINQPNPEMIRKSTESTLGGSE